MTHVLVLVLAALIGVVAGLRVFTAPGALAWAALLGWIDVDQGWASWLGHPVTVTLFTLAAIVEMILDWLSRTKPRTDLTRFGARLIAGAVAGTLLGSVHGYTLGGLGAGMVGATLGTLGGVWLQRRFSAGRRLTYGLVEDVVAVAAGLSIAVAAGAL